MNTAFNYTDYRKFLSDVYSHERSLDRKFTYRHIASLVGFKSAGHFTQIIKGKANISAKLVDRFASGLRLNKREAEYFRHMVLYNQAKNHEDKKRHFERMIAFKESAIRIVDVKQYEFYNIWYYSAVREVLDFFPCDGTNIEQLGTMIQPAITPQQATKALALLLQLGLIQKDDSGRYRKTDAVISTGYEAHSVAINNFVISAADLAKEAIDRFPKSERNLSWMTLSVSPQGFEAIQEELRAFRRRALAIARQDSRASRVYQFNFHVFPLSRSYEGDGA